MLGCRVILPLNIVPAKEPLIYRLARVVGITPADHGRAQHHPNTYPSRIGRRRPSFLGRYATTDGANTIAKTRRKKRAKMGEIWPKKKSAGCGSIIEGVRTGKHLQQHHEEARAK